MHITFDWKNLIIEGGKKFPADCKVRNEINGLRSPDDLEKTIEDGRRRWYMPRTFPSGVWLIKEVEWIDDKDSAFWPVIVRTYAFRRVYIWKQAKNGLWRRSNKIAVDTGYHVHYARYNGRRSSTTHGCINPMTPEIMIDFAKVVEKGMMDKDAWLEVM